GRARVVLADGSTDDGSDENERARAALGGAGRTVCNRITHKKYLAHNKMVAVYDSGTPRWAWTGSLNWTASGLCAQANNGILIDRTPVATHFARQIDLLADRMDAAPSGVSTYNSRPKDAKVGDRPVRVWFTRTVGQVDLKDAITLIERARDGVVLLVCSGG